MGLGARISGLEADVTNTAVAQSEQLDEKRLAKQRLGLLLRVGAPPPTLRVPLRKAHPDRDRKGYRWNFVRCCPAPGGVSPKSLLKRRRLSVPLLPCSRAQKYNSQLECGPSEKIILSKDCWN